MAKLAEILDCGYIVAAHEENESLVTWNGSATLLYWAKKDDGWENTDIRTDYDSTLEEAEKEAKEWLDNPNSDPACGECRNYFPEEELTDGSCENCTDKEDN
jgi:hypothetical protein